MEEIAVSVPLDAVEEIAVSVPLDAGDSARVRKEVTEVLLVKEIKKLNFRGMVPRLCTPCMKH